MGVTGPASDPNPENWAVDSVTLVSPTAQGLRDAALDGLVSDITDAPSQRHFRVNGVEVDASSLPVCPVCASMQPGDRVEVRGTMNNGKVSAVSVMAGGAP
jgi:hypothetical protein